MARRYTASGINCIIDGFPPYPMANFDGWEKPFKGLDYKLAALLPDVDTAVLRNSHRIGPERLSETQIRNDHEWFSTWAKKSGVTIVDSTAWNINQTVEIIKAIAESD